MVLTRSALLVARRGGALARAPFIYLCSSPTSLTGGKLDRAISVARARGHLHNNCGSRQGG